MTPAEKAKETRQRNAEARAAMWQEQRELMKSARAAMQRVLDDPAATSEQLLKAAELLAELGKH